MGNLSENGYTTDDSKTSKYENAELTDKSRTIIRDIISTEKVLRS